MSNPIEIEIVNLNVFTHNLQTKIVTPSKETQVITADEGYYGLREVIVGAPVVDGEEIAKAVNITNTLLSESYVSGNATHNDILEGKEAFVKGKKVQGTVEKYIGDTDIKITADNSSLTLSTNNKILRDDIHIDVEIEKEETTPYDYFKAMLDNDTEDYPYKAMLVYDTCFMAYTTTSTIAIPHKINNGQLNTESESIQDILNNEDNYIEIYDSVYKQNNKFIAITFYYSSVSSSSFKFGFENFPLDISYLIFNDGMLKTDVYVQNSSYKLRNSNFMRINGQYYNIFIVSTHIERKKFNFEFEKKYNVGLYLNLWAIPRGSEIYVNVIGDFSDRNFNYIPIQIKKIEFSEPIKCSFYVDTSKRKIGLYHYIDVINAINISGTGYICNGDTSASNNNGQGNGFRKFICYDIQSSIYVGYGDKTGHLLEWDSLIHTIRELWDMGSSRTLYVGNYNKKRLSNVYVKVIEITNEMIEEDENVIKKKPFALCESTDEEAMLISEYMALKNWNLG